MEPGHVTRELDAFAIGDRLYTLKEITSTRGLRVVVAWTTFDGAMSGAWGGLYLTAEAARESIERFSCSTQGVAQAH